MNRSLIKVGYNALLVSFVAVLLGLISTTCFADIILTDINSTVLIDPASQAGMYSWVVDGKSYLVKQWFWLRIGDAGPEHSLDTLSPPVVSQFDAADCKIVYNNQQGLEVTLKYGLTGGEPESGFSDVSEIIKFTNKGTATLNLHFFQYANFKLSDGNDKVKFLNNAQVLQTAEGVGLSETVVTGFPQHHEAANVPTTLVRLNDGDPTTLNDNGGPVTGDVNWAFQWDFSVLPGDSFIISKDKNINVPEPATLVLLVMGIGCMAFGIRKWRE
jgi:hypothetical protein